MLGPLAIADVAQLVYRGDASGVESLEVDMCCAVEQQLACWPHGWGWGRAGSGRGQKKAGELELATFLRVMGT